MIKTKARIAGWLYVTTIVARIFADGFVRDRLVISNDAAATAANILANQALFRWGFIADIISFGVYVALTAYLYEVFKPVDRTLSLVAAFCSIVSCIAHSISSVFHLAAMSVLTGEQYSGFSPAQQQTLALVLLKIRSIMYHNVGLVFLGFYCLVIGYLIYRSKFMPRVLGLLVASAGAAYMAFFSEPLAHSLLPSLLIPAGVGQTALALWLVVFGVNEERWAARRAAAA